VAHAAGIETVAVADWRARGIAATVVEALDRLAARAEAVHVDVDLDVLDRAFAPAAPGSRPGGLLPAELFEAVRVCGRHRAVRSLGIVECDPERDVADATVLAGALCAVHFAAGLVERLVPR
jgi:formiminoglutamase